MEEGVNFMASLSILAGRRFNPIPRSCILALKSLRLRKKLKKKKSDKEVVFSSPVVNNVRDPFWLEYSTNLTWKEELYLPFSISEWQHQSGRSSDRLDNINKDEMCPKWIGPPPFRLVSFQCKHIWACFNSREIIWYS